MINVEVQSCDNYNGYTLSDLCHNSFIFVIEGALPSLQTDTDTVITVNIVEVLALLHFLNIITWPLAVVQNSTVNAVDYNIMT